MSKKKTKPENEPPKDLDEFALFVKGMFSLTPEEVKEIRDKEKNEGIPKDPDEREPESN